MMAFDVIDLTDENETRFGCASIKIEIFPACSKESKTPSCALNNIRIKRKIDYNSHSEDASKRKKEDDGDGSDDGSISYVEVEISDESSCNTTFLRSPDSATTVCSMLGDEVQVVGTKNHVRLPHMRQHCTENPIHIDSTVFCEDCFCFVCDVKAHQCKFWKTHCKATDQGPTAPFWRTIRQQVRLKGLSILTANGLLSSPIVRAFSWISRILGRKAPFPACDTLAQRDHTLTKCRHCGWFNQFNHQNFNPQYRLGPIGSNDWCLACGRVASESDFGKIQSRPYEPTPGDVLLGTRIMPFTLHAHDPRKLNNFKSKWDAFEGNEGWIFDKADMEEELFLHRLGRRPALTILLDNVPQVYVDNVPLDGKSRNPNDHEHSIENDTVLMENMKDITLLRDLFTCESDFGENELNVGVNLQTSKPYLAGDLSASWDKAERKGTITVRVFCRETSCSSKYMLPYRMTSLLTVDSYSASSH